MELVQLIAALREPCAYPHLPEDVAVLQTHISVVFLAGSFVYKIKKPVNLGFLDFSTLELRRHYCEQEVRLNRRLAPNVYLGVVPAALTPQGVRMEAEGEAIEWVVKMNRLSPEATLEKRLLRGDIDGASVAALAQKIATFHKTAERGPAIAPFASFDAVVRNVRENFEQAAGQVGVTLSREVFGRLQVLTEETLIQLRPLIEDRAARGVPCDTHGDLHLDHVYLFPDKEPPDDLAIIDCIEFNERFRYADPVSDAAFLVMDMAFLGRRDLADVFAHAYFLAAHDEPGRALLPFYTAYRAAVRGKVEGFELAEKEIPADERAAVEARARGHWLLALSELEEPRRRPCLVLVGGLPGNGKSTLARGLAERARCRWIRSDEVRKELAGVQGRAGVAFSHGIYADEWTDHTYAECQHRAEKLLFEGQRVIVDATFREEKRRRAFLDMAARLAVPVVFLVCSADPDMVRLRLDRRRGDVSDADWAVFEKAARMWEEAGPLTRIMQREILTDGLPEVALRCILDALGQVGLS
jgi:aminoglycoside phosphotransferase family enzyme/predicted kinase